MKASEKWARMNNPKTLEDWHISLSEDELNQFPEGRAIIADIKKRINTNKSRKLMRRLGKRVAKIREDVALKCLGEFT